MSMSASGVVVACRTTASLGEDPTGRDICGNIVKGPPQVPVARRIVLDFAIEGTPR
jgi:hypothetical protein